MKCQQLNIFLVVFLNQIKFSQKVIYCMEIKYNCSQYMYLNITASRILFYIQCFVSVLNTNLDTHSNSRSMFLIREVNNISKGYPSENPSFHSLLTQVAKGIQVRDYEWRKTSFYILHSENFINHFLVILCHGNEHLSVTSAQRLLAHLTEVVLSTLVTKANPS